MNDNTMKQAINRGNGMYLQVLGSGSALPMPAFFQSAQLLHIRGKSYLIDCGEGTQIQMRRYRIPYRNLHRIFITHLHGDHCLGLPGLLSSMALLGIKHPIHIYGPDGIEEYVDYIIRTFCSDDEDRITAHTVDHTKPTLVYEDRTITVRSFPLIHRAKTIGYRFDEKPLTAHLNRKAADRHGIPFAYFERIKQGADFVKDDGTVVPHAELTYPARDPYSYAYAADTAFSDVVVQAVEGVDLLYHETTYMTDMSERAKKTFHSTTADAARVAREAGVGHLLFGHYSSRYYQPEKLQTLIDECQTLFPHSTPARDGLLLDFEELRNQRIP